MSQHDPLTSTTRPSTDSIITVRVIKSFTYRTSKNLVLPHVNLELMTVRELQETVRAGEEEVQAHSSSLSDLERTEIAKLPAFKPYRAAVLGALTPSAEAELTSSRYPQNLLASSRVKSALLSSCRRPY